MSVSSLGGVTLVNQMTPAVTTVQNAHDNRVDLQNVAAQAAVQEKEKEVQEVRPTEENYEVDPDREHQRQEADEETSSQKKEKQKDMKEGEDSTIHHLDIMV